MTVDLNSYLDHVQNTELQTIFGGADVSLENLSGAMLLVFGIVLLTGVLWCFFGLKLVRFWSAVLGLAVGFAVGAGVAAALNMEQTVVWIAGGVAAVIVACLGAVLYRVGIFLVVWIAGSLLSAGVVSPENLIMVLVCAGIGLVLALLTVKFAEPVTMAVTGLYGAIHLGTTVDILLPFSGAWVRIAAIALFALLGIWIQFLMESRKRKKQHLRKADEIRKQHSTENEVEKARALMENLDNDSQEEDDITYID